MKTKIKKWSVLTLIGFVAAVVFLTPEVKGQGLADLIKAQKEEQEKARMQEIRQKDSLNSAIKTAKLELVSQLNQQKPIIISQIQSFQKQKKDLDSVAILIVNVLSKIEQKQKDIEKLLKKRVRKLEYQSYISEISSQLELEKESLDTNKIFFQNLQVLAKQASDLSDLIMINISDFENKLSSFDSVSDLEGLSQQKQRHTDNMSNEIEQKFDNFVSLSGNVRLFDLTTILSDFNEQYKVLIESEAYIKTLVKN